MKRVIIDDERSEGNPRCMTILPSCHQLPSLHPPRTRLFLFQFPESLPAHRTAAPSFSSSMPKPFPHRTPRPPNPPCQFTLKHYAKSPRTLHQPCSFHVSLTSSDRRAYLFVQSPFRECRAGSGGRGKGSLLDVDGQWLCGGLGRPSG